MSNDLWIEGIIIELHNDKNQRVIIRNIGRKEVVLANIKTGATFKISKEKIEELYLSNKITFLSTTNDFGELKFFDLEEKEQIEINKRYKFIKKLIESNITKITEKSAGKIISEVAKELSQPAPHWQSVRTWYNNFINADKKLKGLYPKHRFKGSRKPKINEKVIEIINNEAKRYFNISQPSMASIYRNVEEKIFQYNIESSNDTLKVPTYLTVKNRILKNTYKNKKKSRFGTEKFDDELAATSSGIETSKVLERVEVDHTLLDIHVLHNDYKTLLGRPNITVLIDHYSHMVLGFQLSFEKPSFASVCMACKNAFLPKDNFIKALNTKGTWPAHGIPIWLVTDNGNEFWGKHFISIADELGSIFQYCPIRKGRYKSRVERFFGIINSLVLDDLPGVVRKLGKSGEKYDARQKARITITELKCYLLRWLIEVYHNTPLEDSGMTPNEMWFASEQNFPVAEEDEMDLATILMATETRKLNKGRVRLFSMNYSSSIIKDIYQRDGPNDVVVKYDPFDIGYILVRDDINKIYLKAECEDISYASGLSAFEHNKIKERAKAKRKSKLDSLELKKSRVELSKQRDELYARNARRKTQVTTANAARTEKIGVMDIGTSINDNKKILIDDTNEEDKDLDMTGWYVD